MAAQVSSMSHWTQWAAGSDYAAVSLACQNRTGRRLQLPPAAGLGGPATTTLPIPTTASQWAAQTAVGFMCATLFVTVPGLRFSVSCQVTVFTALALLAFSPDRSAGARIYGASLFLSSTLGAVVLAAALVSLAAAAGGGGSGSGEVYGPAFWVLAIVLGVAGLLPLAVGAAHAPGPLGLLVGCSVVQYGIPFANCWMAQGTPLSAYWREVGAAGGMHACCWC